MLANEVDHQALVAENFANITRRHAQALEQEDVVSLFNDEHGKRRHDVESGDDHNKRENEKCGPFFGSVRLMNEGISLIPRFNDETLA